MKLYKVYNVHNGETEYVRADSTADAEIIKWSDLSDYALELAELQGLEPIAVLEELMNDLQFTEMKGQ